MPVENPKIDSQLDIALELPKEELEESNLNTGYNEGDNSWEVIVKYNGDLSIIERELEVQIEILSSNYAIITLEAEKIRLLINYRQIEYIEKPKLLELMLNNSLRESCITAVKSETGEDLQGQGVIIGIIDSGIDYTHADFRNPDGSTRILYIWDQTIEGNPPIGFYEGTQYNQNQINEALNNTIPMSILPHQDTIGHGTHVAGIATGNGRASRGLYTGVASESSLIIVKLGNRGRESFARTTEIMRAIKYLLDKAIELGLPIAINLSYGTNDGSHSGNSLFETYIDDMSNIWKCCICVASGNEGSSGHHYRNIVRNRQKLEIEFIVAGGLKSLFMVIWKFFTDKFDIEVIAPNGQTTGVIKNTSTNLRYNLGNVILYIRFGQPTPYNIDQEIFIEIVSNTLVLSEGIWKLNVFGVDVIDGNFNIWLPVTEISSNKTSFLTPDIYTTLTLPSTSQNVITVGGYNSSINAISDFSGRGYTRMNNMIKPDIVAPAVNIIAPIPGGGYDALTGTSMATPHVTGSAAILMQWGIVKGNDLFLYGEKLKAYLRLGARRDDMREYPNREWGFGKLCLKNSIDNLRLYDNVTNENINIQQNNNGNNTNIEDAIYSNDYIDLVIEYNSFTRDLIKESKFIEFCSIIDNQYAIIHVKIESFNNFLAQDGRRIVSQEPFLLGLMDKSSLEASGILSIQNQPYLNLRGQGVIVAIIDTGIDYTNDAFI